MQAAPINVACERIQSANNASITKLNLFERSSWMPKLLETVENLIEINLTITLTGILNLKRGNRQHLNQEHWEKFINKNTSNYDPGTF